MCLGWGTRKTCKKSVRWKQKKIMLGECSDWIVETDIPG